VNPGPSPPEPGAELSTGPGAGPGRLPGPGDLEPIPGQLALPGMPSAAGAGEGAGASGTQPPLPGLEVLAAAARTGDDRHAGADPELAAVAAELRGLDGDGSRMAAAIRGALDMLLDGQHTGRYRWDQLHKTEKTHAGTLVEIALARSLRLADGMTLDYTIAGADVDCKFSHRMGGWMIPPEAGGKLMLLVQASDEDGTWSAGLLRAAEENLRPAGNRDGKRALNDRGRAAVCWLHARAPLLENALIRLPGRDVDVIFALPSGQQRVNELFRRAQRMRVSRTVVATVAMQDDYMKRVRGGGGARDQLRDEGIVIFGDYAGDQVLASALGLPRPGPGEFVSARLVPRPARPGDGGPGDGGPGIAGDRAYARFIRLEGTDWLLASAADPVTPAPALPR
jgi:Restriction endonuclease NaeI